MRYLAVASLILAMMGIAQEISLVPMDPEALGGWAQVSQALRLYPNPSKPVTYAGPALVTRLFGEIALGEMRYTFLLGVNAQNEVGVWVDADSDGYLREYEQLVETRLNGAMSWSVSLRASLGGGAAFDYPLQILWPMGRGYVFLWGGAPRGGLFQGRRIAVVDGDLDGVFGTKGDFLGVDADGDGEIHAEPDGHEHFALSEPFTLGSESFRTQAIAPDGRKLWLEHAPYVAPKVPLIPGSPAPNFVFRDFATGQELSLQSFRGKVVLLDFWATWCPPCMASLPEIRELYETFHPQGFEIVAVSLDESREELARVLREHRISWPVAFEGKRWDNSLANLYRVYQIPTTYLLDRNGVIRYRDVEGEALREAVAELLREGQAEIPPPPMEVSLGSGPPILSVHAPGQVLLRPGSPQVYALKILNPSAYVARGIRISAEELPSGVRLVSPDPFDLPPRSERTVHFECFTEETASPGFSQPLLLHVEYRYCPDASCFEARQSVQTIVSVEESRAGGPFAGSWWILALLAVGALVALLFFGSQFFGVASLVFLLGLATRTVWKF